MKKFYRVDHREFEPGRCIYPEGNVQIKSDIRRKAEEILESIREKMFKSKPKRLDHLFIFDDLRCADQYWRTHDSTFVYEVSLDKITVRHFGDMNWVDYIGAELRLASTAEPNMEIIEDFAVKYWREEESEEVCRELLVASAVAIQRIRDRSNLKAYIATQVSGISGQRKEAIEDIIDSEKND